MPPTLITPRQGAGPTAIGAATTAVPQRQQWPKGSAVTLTQAVYEQDRITPRAGADVRISLVPIAGESAVASVSNIPLPDVPGVTGAYQGVVAAQALTDLPLGVYLLVTVIDDADPLIRQELTGEVEVLESQGMSGLARPFRTVTEIVEVPIIPDPGPAATPGALAFAGVVGGASPGSRTVTLENLSGAVTVTVLGATGGAAPAWLSASRSGTTLTVTASLVGVPAGVYGGLVRVAAANGTLDIPISLAVGAATPASPGPGVAAAPGALAFTGTVGGTAPASQTLTLTNSSTSTTVAVRATDGGAGPAWLTATRSGATVTVTAALGSLAAGTYVALVRVTDPTTGTVDVPVAFAIAAAPPATPSYGPLSTVAPTLSLQLTTGTVGRYPLTAVAPPGGVLVLQLSGAEAPDPEPEPVPASIVLDDASLAILAGLEPGDTVAITAGAEDADGNALTTAVTFEILNTTVAEVLP